MALENLLVYNVIGDTTYPHGGAFTVTVAGQVTVDDSNGTGDTTLGDNTDGGASDVPDQNVTASTVAGIGVTDILDSRYSYTFTGSDGSSGTVYFLATNGANNYGSLVLSSTPLNPSVTYTFGTFNRNGQVSYSSVVPCFTRGTLIETESGTVSIETLAAGDLVRTMNRGFQPVRWIGSTKVRARCLATNPKLRPVRIMAEAMGLGLPKRDMWVSRQHRMVVSSRIADRMCDGDALVSAIKLTELPGIFVDDSVEEVEYENRAKVGDALRGGISWRCRVAVNSQPRKGYATCQRIPSPNCPIHWVFHPIRSPTSSVMAHAS
ncbi:Hint domain-containing protein [Roseovarius sp. M141]|uniref:Hint domain-containing protein n=1 Tax=Roseovarius sp. M141 TaxID=2583806 RepID=UPI0020CF4B9D|nr:Hint domain-containing protein [Roseovarius sp. M141]